MNSRSVMRMPVKRAGVLMAEPEGEVTTATVAVAVWKLHDRTGKWPERDQIAAYLEVQISVVKNLLFQLRRKRLYRDRVREGATRWMPWDTP